MRECKGGFTLVELLVIIITTGVLSAVVFISIVGVRANARDTQRRDDMQKALAAQNIHYSYNNYFFTDNGANGIPSIDGELPSLTDPGEGSYYWKDNTGCNPAGEYFCVYATLENSGEDCGYETYLAVSEKGIETICEAFQGEGFLGTGCNCW
jgi:type II secretory pathway pseudopilin PulG